MSGFWHAAGMLLGLCCLAALAGSAMVLGLGWAASARGERRRASAGFAGDRKLAPTPASLEEWPNEAVLRVPAWTMLDEDEIEEELEVLRLREALDEHGPALFGETDGGRS